jgi:hypothetical protein
VSGLGYLAEVHLFPVRHHSPRSSAVLQRFLHEITPAAVLVEGPSDAGPLIDVLCDRDTQPPIAILGYRTDGSPRSSLWPFAAYSPEYVALRWAVGHGIQPSFIDISIGQVLATVGELGENDAESAAERDPEAVSIFEGCARARGFRSFEEFWEASFEAPAHDRDSFRSALLAYAALVNAAGNREYHRARDAFMARRIGELVAAGTPPDRMVVVVGAAHAAAFAAGDVDPSLEARLPAAVPSACTLIPYSFPRLAEQLGYGAGNRAPQYYQRAHDAGCDFRRATLEVLVEFTEHLRLRGFAASLADTIEAYRLAVMLAELRGKAEPGLDEVREAAVATMCRGEAAHVDGFLWPSVIGKSVGHVADRIGRNSLQEEFWREVRERRLPQQDSPESFALRLTNEIEVGTSIFLHRLRVAGIPYASYTGTQRAAAVAAGGRGASDPAGGHAALSRVREVWEAQWTPSTDAALVEKIVLGDTLEQVTTRVLEERLTAAGTTGDAAGVLLEAVVTGCTQTMASALRACDRHAADDTDLPSLASACRALSGLVAYGTSRAHAAIGEDVIVALCRKTFDRAVLRVPAACVGNDEAVAPAKEALRTLHEVAMAQPAVDKSAWLAAARALMQSYAVNAQTSGLAAGLLYLAQEITDAEVALIVGQRLSNLLEPLAAASFLEGFLAVNALVLVKSRPVVRALDGFLVGIAADRFRDALPILRRAFGGLGQTERRYLLENIVLLRSLGDQAGAVKAVVEEKDKEKLKEMSDDLKQAMDDLDDLL